MKTSVLFIVLFISSVIVLSSCSKSNHGTGNIVHTWTVYSETETGGTSFSISGLVLGTVTFTSNGQEIRTNGYVGGDFGSVSGNNPDTGYYSLIDNNMKLAERFTYLYYLPTDTTIATGVGTAFDTLNISIVSNNLLVLNHSEGGYVTIDSLER
jgi:hypothetical protein